MKAYTKKQVAEYFQVCERTVDEWVRRKRIPFWKIGRTIRFDLEQVKAALSSMNQ